jgi:hypothetical protein
MAKRNLVKIFNNQTKVENITFKGEDVYISPFHFSDMVKMTNVIANFGAAMNDVLKEVKFKIETIDPVEEGGETTYRRTNEIIFSPELIEAIAVSVGKNVESCCQLISLYTKITFEDLMNKEYDFDYKKAIAIIIAIVQENYSFFMEFISQKIKEMKAEYINQSQQENV